MDLADRPQATVLYARPMDRKLPPEAVTDLDSLFADMFGAKGTGASLADLTAELAISDEEAASGVTKEVAVTRQRPCPPCGGRGTGSPTADRRPCEACGGQGQRSI
jgi:DnaJ-class molecular chaperone